MFVKQNNYLTFNDDKNIGWALHFQSEQDLTEYVSSLSSKCKCKITTETENNHEKTLTDQPDNKGQNMSTKNETEQTLKKNANENADPAKNNILHSKAVEEEKQENITNKNRVAELSHSISQNLEKNVDSDASDSSEATKKADILHRVAKMGKKLLGKEETETDTSDADEKNNIQGDTKQKSLKATPNVSSLERNEGRSVEVSKHSSLNQKQSRSDEQSTTQIVVAYQANNMVPSCLSSEQLSMLLLENKACNSELKVNLMKLQTNLDEVLTIVKKNDSTKRDISTQTSENEDLIQLNQKMSDLVFEQSESLTKLKVYNDSLKTKNEELLHKATASSYEIANLTEKNAKSSSEIQSLTSKIAEQQKEIESLRTQSIPHGQDGISPQGDTETDSVTIKKSRLMDCETNIKQQMNKLFSDACDNFTDNSQYDSKTIKKMIAQTIIHNTYTILQTIKETFSEN